VASIRIQNMKFHICIYKTVYFHELVHKIKIKGIETRAVESESESAGILGGVGVGKNVPTPTPTSV
jgi:hypothetical protein